MDACFIIFLFVFCFRFGRFLRSNRFQTSIAEGCGEYSAVDTERSVSFENISVHIATAIGAFGAFACEGFLNSLPETGQVLSNRCCVTNASESQAASTFL